MRRFTSIGCVLMSRSRTRNVPLVGINRGRLGFLTDVTPEHLREALNAILAGPPGTADFLAAWLPGT